MILQSLVDYYEALAERKEIVPPGWCMERVLFALNISTDGELLGVIPQTHKEQRGKKEADVPDIMKVPVRIVKSGTAVKANFLCENIGYMLGFDFKGNPERAVECFNANKRLHLALLENASGSAAKAVKAYFLNWNPEKAQERPVLKPFLETMATANLVFMIDGGCYTHEDNEIMEIWQEHYDSDSQLTPMRCLVTGKEAPAARIHGKIKGIGSQAAGLNLVSFNERAYESYGNDKAQGLNAPVSEYAAFAYVTALNRLLADTEHRRQIGDTSVVYWAENAEPEPQKAFALFAFPEPASESILDGIMKNLSKGKPIDNINMDGRFYVLGLAPNAARLSVRFFLRESFGDMLENLRQHYIRLEIDRPVFDQRLYLSVPVLLAETVNPKSTNSASSPLMSGAVMRSILTGTRYPESLYQAVLCRIRADGNVSRGRTAIIKAYLIKNIKEDEVTSVALNENSDNRAYVLGRLFAVLENAQKQANPGINTTIKDRYFTSACATPGSVFPQLLKLSNYHTAKAEYGNAREAEKAMLLSKLDVENNPLPAHHSQAEQGIFILGYYHQTQARYSKKEEKDNASNQ